MGFAAAQTSSGSTAPVTVDVKNEAAVNTEGLDFSPTFYEDGIVFISTNTAGLKKRTDEKLKLPSMSILRSQRNTDGATTARQRRRRRVRSHRPCDWARALAGGRSKDRLVAVIAGGACMFSGRTGADVGDRNVAAVRAALVAQGVAIAAEDVGGARGRTMRVEPGPAASVTVRVVGSTDQELWAGAPTKSREVTSLLRAA